MLEVLAEAWTYGYGGSLVPYRELVKPIRIGGQ